MKHQSYLTFCLCLGETAVITRNRFSLEAFSFKYFFTIYKKGFKFTWQFCSKQCSSYMLIYLYNFLFNKTIFLHPVLKLLIQKAHRTLFQQNKPDSVQRVHSQEKNEDLYNAEQEDRKKRETALVHDSRQDTVRSKSPFSNEDNRIRCE